MASKRRSWLLVLANSILLAAIVFVGAPRNAQAEWVTYGCCALGYNGGPSALHYCCKDCNCDKPDCQTTIECEMQQT